MNGRAETHSLVVYLSAKGLSRSFSFTSKMRIKRLEIGELFRTMLGDGTMLGDVGENTTLMGERSGVRLDIFAFLR